MSSFELDFWGRVRNLAEAQRRQYLATVEAERAFRLSLVGQVAATYLQIRAAEEQIALAEQTVTSRRDGLGIAKRRMDAGVTSSVDYDQAAALLTQAETQLAELRRTVAQSQNLLTVLVGGPITAPLPAGRRLNDQNQFAAIEPGLPSALLVNRPDVLQAEQQLLAANANIGAARAAFLPSISLTGLAGFVSPALSSLIDGNSQQYQVQGAALLPIFDWGRRNAQLKLSRAQADELTTAYQRTVQGRSAKWPTRWSHGVAMPNRSRHRRARWTRNAASPAPHGCAIPTASPSISRCWMPSATCSRPSSNC